MAQRKGKRQTRPPAGDKPLTNWKREEFAKYVGLMAFEEAAAAAKAGYATGSKHYQKIAADPAVRARIEYLTMQRIEKEKVENATSIRISRGWIEDEFKKLYQLAIRKGNLNVAFRVLQSLGMDQGMFARQVNVTMKRPQDMTPAELNTFIEELAAHVGEHDPEAATRAFAAAGETPTDRSRH